MDNLYYLVIAYAVVFTGLFLFLLQIAGRLTRLEKKIKALQSDEL